VTAPTTVAPIKRALVAEMRSNLTLKSAAKGGFHEGFAAEKVDYPFVVYNHVPTPYEYDWTSVMIPATFDVFVFHWNPVEANNLDALVVATLHDADLAVDGQTTLYCRRVADLSSTDVDEEGKKIYQVGGTYQIWTDQPL